MKQTINIEHKLLIADGIDTWPDLESLLNIYIGTIIIGTDKAFKECQEILGKMIVADSNNPRITYIYSAIEKYEKGKKYGILVSDTLLDEDESNEL